MTPNRRTVLLVAFTVVLSSAMAGAALTGAATQQDTQATSDSFQITSLDAPMVVTQGDTITVTATVSYPEAAAGTNGTATDETTDNGTDMNESATATDMNESATATDMNESATATDMNESATATDMNESATDTNATATDTNATATDTNATADDSGAVTQSVAFRVQGDVVERQSVTLAPGESTNVTFDVDTGALSPGVYIHGVYTDDFGQEATLIVTTVSDTGTPTENMTDNGTATPTENVTDNGTATPTENVTDNGTATPTENATDTDTATDTATPTPTENPVTNVTETATDNTTATPTAVVEGPSLDVRNLTAPDNITVGETVEASAEVFYPDDPTGGENVTGRVEFRLDGDVVAERNVTLAPGESTNVTFGFDSSEIEPGVYIHSVFTRDYGEVKTITVRPAATENGTATPTENGTATPTENGTDTRTDTPTDETANGTDTGTDTPTAGEADTATA